MSNATLLLESLALSKDAYDLLGRTSFGIGEAEDAHRVAEARFRIASAHKLLEELLLDRAGR